MEIVRQTDHNDFCFRVTDGLSEISRPGWNLPRLRELPGAGFPSPEAARKMLWLAHWDIVKKWTMPLPNWANILNQLAIRFEERFPV